MATATLPIRQWNSSLTWLRDFLREELSPYPGRLAIVCRMVVAVTLITIVGMTWRIPYTFQGAAYALLMSRESRQATLRSAGGLLLMTGVGAAYILISVSFVIDFPLVHFVWVIGSLFLTFYAISALKDYGAAGVLAFMIAFGIPLWDRPLPSETNVEDTLWFYLASLIGVVVTLVVELVLVRGRSGDDIVIPISARLSAIESLLSRYAEGSSIDAATKEQLIEFAMRGASLLRRTLRRSDYPTQYSVEMGGVSDLVGRLVDLATALMQLDFEPSASDQKRLRNLASALASIRNDLLNRRIPHPLQFNSVEKAAGVPLLREIEHTVSLVPEAFASSRSSSEYLSPVDDGPRPALLAADAFVNPDHFRFALKGCLAASICYIAYNAMAWPGIDTAVTTCLLTALTTIGASHQKQILRICGALVGGFVFGMGSQVLILPQLDSIGGFLFLLVVVTAFSGWFMTASPRLSYFGFQVALAFYLINLSEFKMQVSLEVARDRVVGVLLGLFAMWLIFDQLWGMPAARELKKTFISNLRLLAQFAREPVLQDLKAATARRLALGETINTNLDKARALADGVLLEFGGTREQDLALRSLIRRAEPTMRVLYILQNAEWKYRAQLSDFELPEAITQEQREFDDRVARLLDAMADRVEGRYTVVPVALEDAVLRWESAIRIYHSHGALASRLQTLLALGRTIESSMASLAAQIGTEQFNQ